MSLNKGIKSDYFFFKTLPNFLNFLQWAGFTLTLRGEKKKTLKRVGKKTFPERPGILIICKSKGENNWQTCFLSITHSTGRMRWNRPLPSWWKSSNSQEPSSGEALSAQALPRTGLSFVLSNPAQFGIMSRLLRIRSSSKLMNRVFLFSLYFTFPISLNCMKPKFYR